MTNAIEISNLSYRKNMRAILASINLGIGAGKIVGLLGENGAGKTTLMRLIAGVGKGYFGQIAIDGETGIAEKKAVVSFSEPLTGFPRSMRIDRIVSFFEDVYPDFSDKRYNELAGFLQIDEGLKLSQLSKGMREKLIIGLTLSRDAKVYLLDEPFSGIDSMSRKKIINSMIRWKPETATILVSDHYVSEIASILDEVVIIKDQTVFDQKSTEEIREKFGQSIEDYYEKAYEGRDSND